MKNHQMRRLLTSACIYMSLFTVTTPIAIAGETEDFIIS